jgi:hypothetical protein
MYLGKTVLKLHSRKKENCKHFCFSRRTELHAAGTSRLTHNTNCFKISTVTEIWEKKHFNESEPVYFIYCQIRSSVGIVTRYGLDGPGIECWREQIFSIYIQKLLESHTTFSKMTRDSLS